MIRTINTTGKYTIVNGGQPGSLYMNSFSGQTMVGNLRFNPSSQNIEVYDGNDWQIMPTGCTTVGLRGDAEEAITWANQKRLEELELLELCEKHPGLKECYEKFLVMKALVTVEEKEEVK
jgi:hypothetical protein